MKIILVNRFFFPDESATSQLVSELAVSMAAEDRLIHVITSRRMSSDADVVLPFDEVVKGVRVHRVWMTTMGHRGLLGKLADYASFYLAAARAMWKLARAEDLIIAKTDPPMIALAAAIVARLRRARLVNWFQDVFPEVAEELDVPLLRGPVGGALRFLRNRGVRAAHLNVVIGEKMRTRLLGMGCDPGQVRVIPNWSCGEAIPVLTKHQSVLREEWGLFDRFVVAYSGNFGRVHEFATILDAAELLRSRQDICFLMIGRGAQYEALQREVDRRKLENWQFRPFLPRERLAQGLAAADVHLISLQPRLEGLVVPSKFYGVLAAGRPTLFVGALDGEISEVLREHACGTAIAQGDGVGLAGEIAKLAANREEAEAQGARARALFTRKFDRPIALLRWQQAVAAASSS